MADAEINVQEIEIRQEALASRAATELILALNTELIARYPEDRSADHFRLDADEVAPGRGVFLVAYAGDRPLACGAIRLVDADTADVKRMYVAPNAREQGLGRRLLTTLEAEAQMLGAKRIVLETGPRQPEAIALYLRAGYSRTTAFGEYVNSPLSVFMGKDL